MCLSLFCFCSCLRRCFLLILILLFLSPLCPFLATVSFAGYLPVSFCLLSLLFFSDCVPDWTWFGSVYLVTTAEFVVDQ